MKLFYTDQYVLPLPEGHTFPMAKYRLLREQVVASGLVAAEQMVEPHAADDDELARAHDWDYILRMTTGKVTETEMKKIGFPWSAAFVERSRRSSGATIEAGLAAITDGIAINLAGGTHHAFRDHGEGYCGFNDSVVAARALQDIGKVRRVVVIDLDVHQGNGTAAICRDDPSIYTFSMHGARNYPIHKETSDLDIALPDGTGDTAYLDALGRGLRQAIEDGLPDLAIYLAGSDPFYRDRLGRLALSAEGLAERDQMVLDTCRQRGMPLVITMAGGYAQQIDDTVALHWETVKRAILSLQK